ncbi:hypothetical protein ABFU82_17770 [Nocardioides sp. WV_118_6]
MKDRRRPQDELATDGQLIESLAALEHARWAHWQRFMHDQGEHFTDGSILLPPDLVQRWERQIATPYPSLPEAEKQSDREQVLRYLPLVIDAIVIAARQHESGS